MLDRFKYLDEINKCTFELFENKAYMQEKELKVEFCENAIVLPPQKNKMSLFGCGGVVDNNNKYIELSAQLAEGMNDRVNGKYVYDEYDYVDENVVYLNFFIHQWGHFLIDVISRLWYVIEREKNIKIVYTCKLGEVDPIKGNYLEFLKLLGITESQLIMINRPTKFKKVIIPENSMFPGKYYTKEYQNIFKVIKEKIPKVENIPDRIYLSRRFLKTKFKKEVGELDLEKFFNDNGFVSIYPEQLSLIEQLQYFKYAKVIVATSGSLAHNVLFCDNNELIILNKTYLNNLHQHLLNNVSTARIKYIDVHWSCYSILYGYGPFVFTLNENLKRFAKDNLYSFCYPKYYKFKMFKRKIWYFIMYFIIYKIFNKKV